MNEPAFPCENRDRYFLGMTLRDYFAAKAMHSLIAKLPLQDRDGEFSKPYSQENINKVQQQICESAYYYADAMLKERSK